MTATAIDPLDDNPFDDPASGGSLDAFAGLWVIIKPTKVSRKASKFPTSDGTGLVDVVECEIIAVDGAEPGKTITTTSYSGSLNTQIKTKVGKMVIGRLAKKDFPKGPGWNLDEATPAAREMGKKVLADLKAKAAAKAKSEDPFD